MHERQGLGTRSSRVPTERRSTPELGILAEDLSAALAAASRLQQRGFTTAVVSEPDAHVGEVQAVIVDMDIHNTIDDPAGLAATWTRWLRGQGCRRLEARFDSAFRGQPAACFDGFLAGSGYSAPLVVAVPAYPSAGRMCLDGRMLVPNSPGASLSIDVAEQLFGGETAVVVDLVTMTSGVDAVVGSIRAGERSGSTRFVLDATTEEHLSVAAAAVERLSEDHRQILTASSGGWLRYFPDLDSDGFIVVAAPGTQGADQRQLGQIADAYGQRALVTTADDVLQATTTHLEQITSEYRVVVLNGSQRTGVDPWIIAADFGTAVRRILDVSKQGSHRCMGVITSGGLTTGRVIRSLDALELRAGQELEPLCPVVRLHGGPHGGLAVINKASGIGTDETLLRLAKRILGN